MGTKNKPNLRRPRMRGCQLVRFSRPLTSADRFTHALPHTLSVLTLYNNGRHVYARVNGSDFCHLRYRDFNGPGACVDGMRIIHRGHMCGGGARIIVIDDLWEWYAYLLPGHYYNLIDVGYERALFRSRRRFPVPTHL
jgi:hypothetical protein